MDRAVKHWTIAAKLGFDDSLKWIQKLYEDGCLSKDDFDSARLGHQTAIDATKSPQREEAAESEKQLTKLRNDVVLANGKQRIVYV